MLIIVKDLSDARGGKVYFRNSMHVTSDGKVVDSSRIVLGNKATSKV
jgi:hypothetical protein